MQSVSSLLSIVLINLVLSGDNALVIGMAAHRLPARDRRVAIVGGTAVAVLLRVVLTFIAALLLQVPFLQLVGGALLLWIAFRLLKEEEEEAEGKAPEGLRAAIWTIIVADVVMSLDNILGVAGAAHGDDLLLAVGLLISMVLVMFGGSLVAALLNRFWWLAYLGAAVIAWTGGDMLVHDRAVEEWGALPPVVAVALPLVLAAVVVAAAHWFHRRYRRRRPGTHPALRDINTGPAPAGE